MLTKTQLPHFIKNSRKTIEEGGYSLKQIFNFDETGVLEKNVKPKLHIERRCQCSWIQSHQGLIDYFVG
jgi:hypothetical protein